MSDFHDIVQFKKGRNEKTYAVKLGWAKPRDGGGFWLSLDALPFGEGAVAVVPQKDRPGAGGAATKSPAELDDGIPF